MEGFVSCQSNIILFTVSSNSANEGAWKAEKYISILRSDAEIIDFKCQSVGVSTWRQIVFATSMGNYIKLQPIVAAGARYGNRY